MSRDYNSRMTSATRRKAPSATPFTLLGGLSAEEFLAEYWQKKPLLVRQAVPGFTGSLDREGMLALAAREDVESRFVTQAGGWDLRHGPFRPASLRRRKRPWTVLVQGVNLVDPFGDALMRRFDFIPYARLDDLMVSYATDGGGVGPHFDSYDVFLLQGIGRRRWRIGKQKDQTLIDGLPVRILRDFRPTQEWLLEPGDLLYLPPEWAHDGVAEGECMTWSIGFRAFPAQELGEQFLNFLQDRLDLRERFRDPGLTRQSHPAEIGDAMIGQVMHLLRSLHWEKASVGDFLGCYLTEPKPHVVFDAPPRPLSATRFAQAATRRGIVLDRRSLMLFRERQFYLNGDTLAAPAAAKAVLRRLADRRRLAPAELADAAMPSLYTGYRAGFLHLG